MTLEVPPPPHTLREGDTKGQRHSRSQDHYDSCITRLGLELSIIFLIQHRKRLHKVCRTSFNLVQQVGPDICRSSSVDTGRIIKHSTAFVLLPDGGSALNEALSCRIIYVILVYNEVESPVSSRTTNSIPSVPAQPNIQNGSLDEF